uniref:Uncharacterized protein n=1 Tax=Anguilla anguilla TaxID=7936 RepID=A0A0E9UPF5_ANGAN
MYPFRAITTDCPLA